MPGVSVSHVVEDQDHKSGRPRRGAVLKVVTMHPQMCFIEQFLTKKLDEERILPK